MAPDLRSKKQPVERRRPEGKTFQAEESVQMPWGQDKLESSRKKANVVRVWE